MAKEKPYTLVGVDGNAFCVMGYTAQAMKDAGMSKDEVDKMYSEATSGNYSNLLCVCCGYIDKVNEKLGLTDDDDEEDEDDGY